MTMKRLAVSLFAVSVAVSCAATMEKPTAPPPVVIQPDSAPVFEQDEPGFDERIVGPEILDNVIGNRGFLDGMECFRTGNTEDFCWDLCLEREGIQAHGCFTALDVYRTARSFDAPDSDTN